MRFIMIISVELLTYTYTHECERMRAVFMQDYYWVEIRASTFIYCNRTLIAKTNTEEE